MTRSRATRSLVAVALVAAACLALAAGAQARWGPYENCSALITEEVNHHCYALEQLEMKGYPLEYVSGGVDFVDTTYMEVPTWTSGDFVSNEQWVGFETTGGWIETGQIAGGQVNCCSVHPFFAATTAGVNGLYFYESPSTASLNTYNHYVIYDPQPRGTWRVYWGCCEVKAYGAHEFPTYSEDLEAGFEGGASEQPYNWGRDEVASVVPPKDAWAPYETSYRHASTFRSPGMCLERNYEAPAWGNIIWGTCKAPN